jgi:hypothetical protein
MYRDWSSMFPVSDRMMIGVPEASCSRYARDPAWRTCSMIGLPSALVRPYPYR